MATVAYRQLLRTSRELFAGDKTALGKARQEIRSNFEKSRKVTDSAEIRKLLSDAAEADDFMRRHLVQARLTPRGTYAVALKDPDAKESTNSHVNFEPLHPQEAIEKSQVGFKKPSVVKTKTFYD